MQDVNSNVPKTLVPQSITVIHASVIPSPQLCLSSRSKRCIMMAHLRMKLNFKILREKFPSTIIVISKVVFHRIVFIITLKIRFNLI